MPHKTLRRAILGPVAMALVSASACSVDLRLDKDARITCSHASDCPAGFECQPTIRRCVRGSYTPACGNHIVDEGETCDDGNTASGDGCSFDCRSDERCGNGIADLAAGEECDCGDGTSALPAGCNGANSLAVGASCRPSCKRPGCGDGVVEFFEQCERDDLQGESCASLGFERGALACSPFCRFDVTACEGYCGDGVLDSDEQCDGDDLGGRDCRDFGFYDAPGLACDAVCRFDTASCTGYCGDRLANGVEACEGMPPADESCIEYGYESGVLSCSASCALDFAGCRTSGWLPTAFPETGRQFAAFGQAPPTMCSSLARGGTSTTGMALRGRRWTRAPEKT